MGRRGSVVNGIVGVVVVVVVAAVVVFSVVEEWQSVGESSAVLQ
jgi:hypothetical protein